MATIPGSQFVATAAGQTVNIVEPQGLSLLPPVAGAFNLELFTSMANASPTAAPGYQGVAVLSPSGLQLDLIAGAFAVTDNGTGSDTINAFGNNETIAGGSAGVSLNLYGNDGAALGGSGPAAIAVSGNNDSVNGGSGDDTINVIGTGDTITAGSGSDTINVVANFDTIDGGTGPSEVINVVGTSDFIKLGTGSDTVAVSGSADTVTAGAAAGSSQGLVTFSGSNMTFVDGGAQFADTVVGFDQAAGDRIHLTNGDTVATSTQVNGGQDTLITLSDNSTILLKGVTHVDSSFFS
jgi:hypothetical protein